MMRASGVVVGLALAGIYVFGFTRMFRVETVVPSAVHSVPINFDIRKVSTNESLQALVLDAHGSAMRIDCAEGIETKKLEPVSPFQSGVMCPSGVAYLIDARKVLYRWSLDGKVIKSRPLKIEGEVGAITVEESNRTLWCATIRQTATSPVLMVYGIKMENGKLLGAINLESQKGDLRFYLSGKGNGVVLTAFDNPGAFYFKRVSDELESKYLNPGDRVNAVIFSGNQTMLGLNSGYVGQYDPSVGQLLSSAITDSLPVTNIAASPTFYLTSHGASDVHGSVGSAYLSRSLDNKIVTECSESSSVSGSAAIADGAFVIGSESGRLVEVSATNGCRPLRFPKGDHPGPIYSVSSNSKSCLVIGRNRIALFEFGSSTTTLAH